MKVLITGSEGNIGSDGFINYFKKIFNGTVYLTDIKGKRKNNFFKVDLTDEKQLKKLPKNIDIIIHMASIGLPTKIQNIY
ncbi:NAD-dependent epimerase/dehydratase family protein, partial [bacterium]|nr:NAD-dependent epimerase/dehydratase family protein [bacterium]